MKRCPTCQTTYTDESLNFCLQDGATLVSTGEPSSSHGGATLILPTDAANYLAKLPTEALAPRGAATEHLPPTSPTVHVQRSRETAGDASLAAPPQKSNTLLVAGVTAIVILLLALVGIGAALLFRGTGEKPAGDERGGVNSNNRSNNNSQDKESNGSDNRANANEKNGNSVNQNGNTSYGNEADAALNITATASSTRVPLKSYTYEASHVLDKNLQTAWIEGIPGPGIGEWIRCDFAREVKLNRVTLTPGYFKNPSIWKQNNRLAAAILYFSDGSSRRYTFPDQMQERLLDTGGVRTRFVRLVINEMYPGSVDSEDTAISEISFDWEQ
jgi:hypothetical protein